MSAAKDWKSLSRQEKVKELLALKTPGITATQLAEALVGAGFAGVTRGAVIGVMSRAGIRSDNRSGKASQGTPSGNSRKLATRARRLARSKSGSPKSLPIRSNQTFSRSPEEAPVLLSECKAHQCNYPIWPNASFPAPEEMFVCGAPVRPGSNYCEHHHNACNIPPIGRRS